MAFTARKKTSPVFSIPSYLPTKKSKMNDKVDQLIRETIKEKVFKTLDINRKVYIRLIEYFSTYTLCEASGEKIIASFRMRIRSKSGSDFKVVPAKEIELLGVNIVEFEDYLYENGAVQIKPKNNILLSI